MKILFINKAHPILRDKLEAAGFICEEDITSSKTEIEAKVDDYFGIVMRSRISIDKAIIDAAKQLKFIAREGVGLEHIDVEYAANKGIDVIISPEGSRDTVGEHALGMLLMLMNNLGKADREVRAGIWEREANRATEIKGKTIGIIGYGNMGQSFARKVSGFEAKVLAYDKFRVDYGDQYAEAATLERLFAEADIITLHIPFLPENHYFVNDAFINSFAKNIYLINTARGIVLECAALVNGLKSGKVRGAGLDVLEYEEQSFTGFNFAEPPADFQYLQQADNVVLAPHIAGWSFESKAGHARVLAEKIRQRFVA